MVHLTIPLLASSDLPAEYVAGITVSPEFSIDVSADIQLDAQELNGIFQWDSAQKTVVIVGLETNFHEPTWAAALASAGVRSAIRATYTSKVTALVGRPVRVQLDSLTDASLVSMLKAQLAFTPPNVLTEMYWQYPEGTFVAGDSLTFYWSVPFAAGTATNPRMVTYDPRFTVTRPTLQTPAVDVVVALRVVVT